MEAGALAVRRRQMGEALQPWATAPGAVHSVTGGSWLLLTGLPSPDVNLALVHGEDVDGLDEVLAAVDRVGAPTSLMLAGAAMTLTGRLAPSWVHVGAVPFMRSEVAATPRRVGPRVRRAGAADRDVLMGLWSDAFGIPPEISAPVVDATLAPASVAMSAWLLEDHGEAVSTVVTARVGDAVTLWSMATPERFARRGYARALLADVMARASEDGAAVGLLGATPAGKPLYDATGWTTIEHWEMYTNDSGHTH